MQARISIAARGTCERVGRVALGGDVEQQLEPAVVAPVADAGRAALADRDQARLLQALERLAHGVTAGLELLAEPALRRQRVPGGVAAGEDLGAQLRVDLARHRTGWTSHRNWLYQCVARNTTPLAAVNTAMRILFATTRGAGHVGPLIPFAHACLAAGHDVRMAAAPSAEPHVRRAGLPFAALDEPDAETMAALWPRVKAATPDEAGRMVFEEVFAGEFARSALPGMLKLAYRWRPDVIVRETCEFASPLVAEAVGVPDVHVACFLAVLGNTDWDLYKPLGRLRKEFGLAPSSRDRSIEPYLTLAPRSLEHPAFVEIPGTRRFRAPEAQPRPLPDWWSGPPRPLVYVSFGSAAAGNGFFPEVYRDAAQALGELPVRVLMTLGTEVDPADLGPVPGNVHVESWVPQSAVMAHASVMVGHGGSGSTLAAMAAGMPLAVVPLFADQPDNAERIDELGAGLRLDGVSGLAAAVHRAAHRTVVSPSRRRGRRGDRGAAADRARRRPARGDRGGRSARGVTNRGSRATVALNAPPGDPATASLLSRGARPADRASGGRSRTRRPHRSRGRGLAVRDRPPTARARLPHFQPAGRRPGYRSARAAHRRQAQGRGREAGRRAHGRRFDDDRARRGHGFRR